MDFGAPIPGLDSNVVASYSNNEATSQVSLSNETNKKFHDFMLDNKQERQSLLFPELSTPLFTPSNSMIYDIRQQPQVLNPVLNKDDAFMETIPFNQSSSAFARNTVDYGSENLNTSMNGGAMLGERSVFTWSQWMELEQQALIYKYISANLPAVTPLNKKPLLPYPYGLSAALFPPNFLEWSGLRYIDNNGDPEPGRCRRTDGKKWRCAKDAVADQKYCEKHINRGRHRPRKPAGEAQTSNATSLKASKMVPSAPNNSPVKSITPQQSKNLEPEAVIAKFPAKRSYTNSQNVESFFSFFNEELYLPNNNNNKEVKSDWTQLSMSIPMQKKPELSTISQKESNRVPISWDTSPLGEVLTTNTGATATDTATATTGTNAGTSDSAVLPKKTGSTKHIIEIE